MKTFLAVCSLSGWNAREGSPGHAISIESSHGREKGRTSFASTRVGKRKITITVARSYSQMIRRDRLPIPLQEREPGWDLELGIRLAS